MNFIHFCYEHIKNKKLWQDIYLVIKLDQMSKMQKLEEPSEQATHYGRKQLFDQEVRIRIVFLHRSGSEEKKRSDFPAGRRYKQVASVTSLQIDQVHVFCLLLVVRASCCILAEIRILTPLSVKYQAWISFLSTAILAGKKKINFMACC